MKGRTELVYLSENLFLLAERIRQDLGMSRSGFYRYCVQDSRLNERALHQGQAVNLAGAETMTSEPIEVTCEKCGHTWHSKAKVIRCPKKNCHSSRNAENRRRRGGPWAPDMLPKRRSA